MQGTWRNQGAGLNRIEEYKLYRKQHIPTWTIEGLSELKVTNCPLNGFKNSDCEGRPLPCAVSLAKNSSLEKW